MDPASFNHRSEALSTGRTYHFVDQLPEHYDPKRSTTLLCVHGFPDLWYGWRYQIRPWVREGYRVVAPDMLGYGGTDKPQDPLEYSTQRLCADLAALLDLLGVHRAVVIGHDWGAYTAARFALWHPERLSSLILLSVPYTPPSRVYKPIEDVVKLVPNFAYQAYFADSASTAPIEKDLRAFLSIIFKTTEDKKNFTSLTRSFRDLNVPKDPSVLNDKEFQVYLDALGKGGMTGPLNYYRTSKYRHEEEERAGLPANLSRNLPVLFMWGTADSTVAPAAVQKARKFIAQLQDVAFEGRGHWLMVEAKDEITNKVISWLRDLTRQPVRSGKL